MFSNEHILKFFTCNLQDNIYAKNVITFFIYDYFHKVVQK
jgi:hypothetical protein